MNNINLYLATQANNATKAVSKKYELIETITVTEDGVNSISRTQDLSGVAYDFERMLVKITTSTTDTNANIIVKTIGNPSKATFENGITTEQGNGTMFYEMDLSDGIRRLTFSSVELSGNTCTLHSRESCFTIYENNITSLTVSTGSEDVPFPLNSVINIFAVRC